MMTEQQWERLGMMIENPSREGITQTSEIVISRDGDKWNIKVVTHGLDFKHLELEDVE
jgi:hypothetical protein|tara:strand:- start:159 stop:332 length:174 start_codon:yes stop_codon:yes gene_type:complete